MKNKEKGSEGLAIPAGLFIGMGLGFLFGNFPAWLFIGLGAGFVTMAILRTINKK